MLQVILEGMAKQGTLTALKLLLHFFLFDMDFDRVSLKTKLRLSRR